MQEWKSIILVELWRENILAYEILIKGKSVDSYAYLDFLNRRLFPEIEKNKFGHPLILHDNGSSHNYVIIKEFYKKNVGMNLIILHIHLI